MWQKNWVFWGFGDYDTSNKAEMAESNQIKYLILPFYYQFIQQLFYVFYQLPSSMLSVLINKPLEDGQSVCLAHRAPSHYVKKHIENIF